MEDPGIKLFGKKIVLPEISKHIDRPLISTAGEEATGGDNHNKGGGSDHNHGLVNTCLEGNRVNGEDAEKDKLKSKHSEIKDEFDNPKTPSIHEENEREKPKNDTKTLKKTDKILRCPRCSSMDTKFCYFNNYNVNQPRHFCKSCQRYWTAGGAMRNMLIGAGRRKNKNPATHCRYITIPQEVLQPAIPIPAIFPPLPIYPSSYWNCIPFLPPLTSHSSDSILGKHSRDGFLIKRNDCDEELKKMKNSSVLIPKTLRIDDPDEAAKSSIWATLGIKSENFKAFQEKGEETKKRPVTMASPALEANPAAFSRSLCFQESA